ncbi:MAG: UvrD-helicase domain-containing protein, partial [Pirellulales bacterium]|nr:UvrD-helicase domain-containing protein [Pirellulales bacterium]
RASFDATAARPAAEAALQAIGLAADVAEQYERRKRELAVLDFNDLLIHARRLLVGSEQGGLRKRLAAQIRLLLVDEFQDTDPLQVELVKALCDNEHLRGKLFLVGDYKQSIYRFRGADPRVFGRLREEFSAAGRLPLSLNFRSQPAVLDFVNALFAEELGPEYEPLRAARPQVGPAPAVEFLWAGDHKAATDGRAEDPARPTVAALWDDMGPRERLRRREAEWIARRIRAMLDSGEKIVWDNEASEPSVRAVRPGDVALLFRAMTNAEYYEDALQRYGIDYYLVGGRAFYAQQEIYDLLNLLRTLDGRCDEVSLAGALRSPLFSLHDETLFRLARHSQGLAAGLFEGELPAELDADQREQAEFAAATIRDLRAMKDRLPVARLIQAVLDRTGYDAVLLAEFLGERKLANLHKLIEQARSFDHSGVFALSDFITQLAEFVARQPDEPLAATCPESTDVVKLMSIHQSKGLEFPVVIVPDVGRSRRIMGPPVAFTPQLGPMLKDPDATTGYDLFMAAENDEDAAEHSRLLYVAATRAADYLILSSGVKQPGEAAGPWMEMIARRFDLMTGQQRGPGASGVGGQRSEVGGQSLPVGVAVVLPHQQTRGGSTTATPTLESRTPNPEPLVTVTTEPPPIQSKPVDLRLRRDLEKIVEKAGQMAADGAGRQPRYLAPLEVDRIARRQFSFSRLSGELHAGANVPAADRLDETASPEPQLDPRGLGTLVHAVLEQIDFAKPEDVQKLVERLAPEHLPAEGLDLGEPIDMVGRFLHSPRAAELAAAKELYRELEFLLAWPSHKAATVGRAKLSDGCHIRGYIDCLYRDAAGRWRLIDFKTGDETTPEQHEMQMLGYALAVESIQNWSLEKLTLCFLRSGLEHHFPWNDENRRKVIRWVNDQLS